jgi:hypothetical protein
MNPIVENSVEFSEQLFTVRSSEKVSNTSFESTQNLESFVRKAEVFSELQMNDSRVRSITIEDSEQKVFLSALIER